MLWSKNGSKVFTIRNKFLKNFRHLEVLRTFDGICKLEMERKGIAIGHKRLQTVLLEKGSYQFNDSSKWQHGKNDD